LKSGYHSSEEFTNQFGVEEEENLESDTHNHQCKDKDEKELNESPHSVEITVKV
jgi:hypothetical protein